MSSLQNNDHGNFQAFCFVYTEMDLNPESVQKINDRRFYKMRWLKIFLLCIIAFALSSCAASPDGTEDSQNSLPIVTQEYPASAPLSTTSPELPGQFMPVLPAQGETTPMATALPTPYDPGLQSLIEKAREDLAKRISAPANEINVSQAFAVDWPDSGLGCTQAGLASAQVITPGYLILLEYGNNRYEYHGNKGTYVIYCMNPVSPNFGTPSK
jgi:hypothetical protein